MKNLLSFICLFLATKVFAINPVTEATVLSDKFETGSVSIDAELCQLNLINTLVLENNLTFAALSSSHAELVVSTHLSESVEDGVFDSHEDSPIGVAGFWWGFCFGVIGLLVVYLTMDEGSGRKEQVNNAVWGCVTAAVLNTIIYVIINANNLN